MNVMADLSQYADIDIINIVSSDAEAELKKRGYDYGWYKIEPYVGSIYILVNPAFPNLVKIGYADDVQKRMRSLNSNSGLPDPYHCYAIYKVRKRLEDLKLHGLIDSLDSSLRHAKNREFYEMDAQKAYSVLSAIAQISGDEEQLVVNPFNDDYFDNGFRKSLPIVDGAVFSDAGNKGKDGITETMQLRYDFWQAFEDYAFKDKRFVSLFKPRKRTCELYRHYHGYSMDAPSCGLTALLLKSRNNIGAEVYIGDNKALFHSLFKNKDAIEKEIGLRFEWKELPNRTASRIVVEKPIDFTDKSKWKDCFDWFVDTLVRMKTVFRKYL